MYPRRYPGRHGESFSHADPAHARQDAVPALPAAAKGTHCQAGPQSVAWLGRTLPLNKTEAVRPRLSHGMVSQIRPKKPPLVLTNPRLPGPACLWLTLALGVLTVLPIRFWASEPPGRDVSSVDPAPMNSPAFLPPAYAAAAPRSTIFRVSVDGQQVETLATGVADFASWTLSDGARGPQHVVIETQAPIQKAFVRPLSRGVVPVVEGHRLTFDLPGAVNLCVEIAGLKTLFLYANAPERERPAPDAPGVHFFAAGKVYEVGELHLGSGETLYIEEGAIVRGCVRARDAQGVRIAGRGVLDGGGTGSPGRMVLFDGCEDVRVADIIMIQPKSWMLVLGGCRGVSVSGLKEIGEVVTSDGIDVVGSRDVHIEGCCLRNNDDCIAIKARNITGDPTRDDVWQRDVENVLVERCVFWNDRAGNAMEIGFELRAARVANIVFRDCDVLCVHGFGAVFSIHNGDRATVEDVLWENIRVEHYYDRLVDFRIVLARYSRDPERGSIRRIRLKNIRVMNSPYNPGSSVSLIGGYDARHPVGEVDFEDLYLNDKKVLSPDDIDLLTRHADHITFR